jgi:hypothetical protein
MPFSSVEDEYAMFWLADGSTHKIRIKYLAGFYHEAFANTGELSRGAYIVKNAVASKNAGRLTELLAMIQGKPKRGDR